MRKLLLSLFALLTAGGAAWADGPDVKGKTFTLTCDRGSVYWNGEKMVGSKDGNKTEFAIIEFNEETYLYDATNGAFVINGADDYASRTAGSGNPLYESTDDFRKIVKGLSWGSTDIEAYPWYLEDENGSWLNMDGTPIVYLNKWKNFEGGTGGNTYLVEIVEPNFDDSEAIALLENYDEFPFIKSTALANVAGLSDLPTYTDYISAIEAADSEATLEAALAALPSAYITLQCRNTSNYLKVGDPNVTFVASPTGSEEVIMLEPAGNGSFYMKGVMSNKYVGDVKTSTQITSTTQPEVPFYIQKYNNYIVVRPTKYSDDSQNYIHNNGCVGWGRAADNSQHYIAEVEAPNVTTVTYSIYHDNTLITTSTVVQEIGAPASVPNRYISDYVQYTYDAETIQANTTAVRADAEYVDLPFEFSTDYETAKWYYLHGHSSNAETYISTNGDATVWANGNNMTKAYMWAFIGNPIEGVQLINMAAGETKAIQGTNPATMGTDGKVWVLKKQTNESYIKGRPNPFGLYDASLTYLNTQGATLKYWGGFDEGSTFWVNDPAESFEQLVAKWQEKADETIGTALNKYHLAGTYTGQDIQALISSVEAKGYSTETFIEGWSLFDNLEINQPKAGTFLRLTGKTSGKHLAAGNASNGKYNMTDAADATTIFYYDGTHLTNLSSGQSNGMHATAWNWVYGTDNASKVTFSDGNTNGGYQIYSSSAYFYDAGDTSASADRGGSNDGNARYNSWQLTEITDLPITVSQLGFATLWSPVALEIPEGVTAYTGVISDDKTYLKLTAVEGTTLPALTAVVLQAEPTEYTFSVSENSMEAIASDLNGGLGATVEASSILTLQQPTEAEVPGFYTYTGTGAAGFKAYLNGADAAEIKGFIFGDDATGIAGIENGNTAEGTALYNLAGQRVAKTVKGIYVVGGKKVLVK